MARKNLLHGFRFLNGARNIGLPKRRMLEMSCGEGTARMALEIGFKIAGLLLTVEGNGGLNSPRLEWGGVRDSATVVAGKTLLQISGVTYVVMGACGNVCENIDVVKWHK